MNKYFSKSKEKLQEEYNKVKVSYVGWSKDVHDEDIQLQKGEIYYEDGFVYKGEIDFFLPHGKGTGTHKDGNSRTGNWFNGNLEDKLN